MDTRVHVDNVEVLSGDTPYCLNRPTTVNCNYLKAILRVNITGARTFSAFREEQARRVISEDDWEAREDQAGAFNFSQHDHDINGSPHSSTHSNEHYYDDDDCDDPEL